MSRLPRTLRLSSLSAVPEPSFAQVPGGTALQPHRFLRAGQRFRTTESPVQKNLSLAFPCPKAALLYGFSPGLQISSKNKIKVYTNSYKWFLVL
jgi:hypothetical protein